MLEQFANQVSSTLNGALDASTTSVIVASATGFPTSGQFSILVESELMTVTAVSAETFTVTRGAESTTAATHAHGITVKAVLSKRSMEAIRAILGHVQMSGSQTIATSTDTIVTFATVVTNDSTFTSGGTDRLVAPEAGRYILSASVRWDAQSGGKRYLWFKKNGSFTNGPIGSIQEPGDAAHCISFGMELAAADYIQVDAYQDRGGNTDILGGSFSLLKVG